MQTITLTPHRVETTATRYQWVDMMKVVGMYFIVAGHFFPAGIDYIYSFSVSLFFTLSGLLTKRKSMSTTQFIKTQWCSLIIPMLIYGAIYSFYNWLVLIKHGMFMWFTPFESVGNIIVGNWSGAVWTCWCNFGVYIIEIDIC